MLALPCVSAFGSELVKVQKNDGSQIHFDRYWVPSNPPSLQLCSLNDSRRLSQSPQIREDMFPRAVFNIRLFKARFLHRIRVSPVIFFLILVFTLEPIRIYLPSLWRARSPSAFLSTHLHSPFSLYGHLRYGVVSQTYCIVLHLLLQRECKNFRSSDQ